MKTKILFILAYFSLAHLNEINAQCNTNILSGQYWQSTCGPYSIQLSQSNVPSLYGNCGDYEIASPLSDGNIPTASEDIVISGIIYPNPFSDIIFIESRNADSYSIYDIQGRLMLSNKLYFGRNQIDVSNLFPSVYLIHLFKNNQINHSSKIIKF